MHDPRAASEPTWPTVSLGHPAPCLLLFGAMPTLRELEPPEVLALLKRHGHEATSFAALGAGFRYLGDADACVPFVDTGGAWVAAGGPIASAERLPEVAEAFVAEAQRRGRRALFFATEGPFVERAPAMSALLVGEQPFWTPSAWPETVRRVKSLREQLRRARAKKVVVELLDGDDVREGSPRRKEILALVERWLGTRTMAPMGFVVQVEPFVLPEERRYFVALREQKLVGVLVLVPIFARSGWFLEDFLRDPLAPNGTVELLFDAAMTRLAAEGATTATMGIAPLAGPVSPWLRRARTWGRPLYDFAGLRAFKTKLRPERWEPVYVSLPPRRSVLLAIYDVLTAFSGRGLIPFGITTLFRGPDLVMGFLTALLVPWTALLAFAAPPRWFPDPWVQDAWVGFDALLTFGLVTLVLRWQRGLSTLLASAITLDALVTLVEALVWNVPRMLHAGDALALLGAVAAPAFAAVVMWRSRARHVLLAGG